MVTKRRFGSERVVIEAFVAPRGTFANLKGMRRGGAVYPAINR